MSKYKIHRVYVSAGTTETLTVDYEHTTNELYFWAFPDTAEGQEKHIEEGSIESWMNAGKCICIGDGQYRFFGAFTCGYTVFVARKSDADTIPEQKPYGAFPLASLIQSIGELIKRVEEDATEILRALRAPEADGKMILPMKNRRAGKILGFNDAGFPTVGEDCKQVSELFDAQKNCASYVEQAALKAQESANHADYAQRCAREAGDSATESDKHADDALRYAQEALSSLQKIGDQAHKAIEEINRVAGEVSLGIDGELRDVESNVSEDAALTKELVQRAEEIYQSLSALKENYSGLQCFISCAAKHVENNRMFVENLLAENAEGLNMLDTAKEALKIIADGHVESATQELPNPQTEAGNDNYYAYWGTLTNIGAEAKNVIPKTISFYRRDNSGTTNSDVPRYVRILRKDENNLWYVSYQSENALAPNNFTENAEMMWQLKEVAGGAIPPTEQVAIVQTDNPDSEATNVVMWGAKSTLAYNGGVWSLQINDANKQNRAPSIKLRYSTVSVLVTQDDLACVKAELAAETSSKITALTVQSGSDDNNAGLYGWRGTLRSLGAFGDAVSIEAVSIKRGSGNENSGVALWARLLKQVGDAWTIVAQSTHSRKFGDVAESAELTWEMQLVDGVIPPSADEHVAIVFVNDTAKAANASDGLLRFRTVSNIGGGITGTLSQSQPSGQSYSPWLKLRFAPLAGTRIYATQENLETLANALASAEQQLNSLGTDVSLKADSDALTSLADRVAALEAASAGTEE